MWKGSLWAFPVYIKGINTFLLCFLQNAYRKDLGRKKKNPKFLDLKELLYFIEKGTSFQELTLAYVKLIFIVIVKFCCMKWSSCPV